MRSTRQTVIILAAVALLCAIGPLLMTRAGFTFLSTELGGVGDHFGGYDLDGAVLRLDLVLAFAGVLGLALALSLPADLGRRRDTVIIAATIAAATVVASVQVIPLAAGGMPEYLFRRHVFDATQVAHALAATVLLTGFTLLRLRRRLPLAAACGILVTVAAAMLTANLTALRGHEFSAQQVTTSHVAVTVVYGLAAMLVVPELRRRPLPLYPVSVLAAALPLAISQLSPLRLEELDPATFNQATLLVWCSLFITVLGLSIDLARSAADHTRERERADLRNVLDALPDLVFTRDRDGHYRLINRAAAAFLGGEPHEFEGLHALACSHDQRATDRALRLDRRILADGRPLRHAGMQAVDAAGDRRCVQLRCQPLDPGHGEPDQVLSVATDVTQLKTAERRLASRLEGEQLLRRSLVRLLRSPVTDFPAAMHEVLARLGRAYRAAAVFAYEIDETAGVMRPREYWHVGEENPRRRPHDLAYMAWAMDRLRDGQAAILSHPDELPDDPALARYMQDLDLKFVLFVPVFSKDGSLWGVLGGHFNEAPADRADSLRRLLGYLADVYTASRDHYLADRELQEASRAAAASARAKGEFLANMSHEIRTPLNAMIGLADILRGLGPSDEQSNYLDMINQAGDALLGIINDVLDISKIEAGQLALDPVPVDLPALLGEIVDMMAYHAQQQGLELVYHLDPTARLRADLDAVRIKQVLINLLNNAIKFTEHGHVSLRVRAAERDGATWCRLDVADTGIGIPAETRDSIFDMFTQADASHTRRYGGTGLGLAICRNLVELMGGTIALSSKVGRGTRFTVELPLTGVGATARPPLPDPDLAGRRFVAVMPVAAARENLAVTMTELGLGGVTLPDTHDLARHLRGEPVDLVVADGQMDSVMLAELCAITDAIDPAPRRLLLTPLGDDRDPAALAAEGWQASVQKPVRRPNLRRQLYRLLAPERSSAVAPARPRPAAVLSDRRVLLVEDNVFNQKVATRLLQDLGCQVTLAADGEQALGHAANGEFDLVLMDCQMPVMDGLEATRRIRRLDGTCGHVPVVAMTANVVGEHREQCLAAGMDDFASKPINKKTLRSVLERWAVGAPREAEPVGQALAVDPGSAGERRDRASSPA